VLAAAVLSGCGVPTSGTAQPLDRAGVPYGLMSPLPSATASPTPAPPAASGPRVYFLDGDRLLTAVALDASAAGRGGVAEQVLERLSSGPDPGERDQGLQSALGPQVRLRLEGVDDGVARVEVPDLPQDPTADRIPLAVGQVVLSLTTVPGVRGVSLLRDGEVLEVPTSGGARTSGVLVAADYSALVDPSRTAGGPGS